MPQNTNEATGKIHTECICTVSSRIGAWRYADYGTGAGRDGGSLPDSFLTIFQRLPIDTNCSFTSCKFISAENGLLQRWYYYLPFFFIVANERRNKKQTWLNGTCRTSKLQKRLDVPQAMHWLLAPKKSEKKMFCHMP